VVKHWANSRDLNDASQGTLNSFGWALLVIQYLQMLQPPILPSLQQQSEDIRREESKAGLADKLAPADPQDVVAAGVKSTASEEPQSPFIPSVTLRDPHLPRFHASSPDERVWMRGDNNNGAAADSNLGSPAVPSSSSPQLGALFIGFLHFYAHVFSADAHVVNIRAGGLCPRSSWAGSHRFTSGAAAGLCIVDPFAMDDNGL
jgi:DNA polymerase sigma